MSAIDKLLGEIDLFCKQRKISKSTFGLHVVNDGKLVNRLRDGKGITLKTITRIQEYLDNNTAQGASQNSIAENINNDNDGGNIMPAAKIAKTKNNKSESKSRKNQAS